MSSQNSGRAPLTITAMQQFAVPTGGNASQLPSLAGHIVQIKARCPAGQVVYIGRFADGVANIPAADGNGNKSFPLKDGEWEIFEVKNANVFAVNGTAAGAFVDILVGVYIGV